jgi:hypothetical protein
MYWSHSIKKAGSSIAQLRSAFVRASDRLHQAKVQLATALWQAGQVGGTLAGGVFHKIKWADPLALFFQT